MQWPFNLMYPKSSLAARAYLVKKKPEASKMGKSNNQSIFLLIKQQYQGYTRYEDDGSKVDRMEIHEGDVDLQENMEKKRRKKD